MRTLPSVLAAFLLSALPFLDARADEAQALREQADAVSARALRAIDEVAVGVDACPADAREYPEIGESADGLYEFMLELPRTDEKTSAKVRLALSIVDILGSELILRGCAV